MMIKLTIIFRDELSLFHLKNTLVQGILYYTLLLFCLSLLMKSSPPEAFDNQTLTFMMTFNFILLSTLIPPYFSGDFSDGYLTWLKGREGMLRSYFLAKIMGGFFLAVLPIVLLSLFSCILMEIDKSLMIPFSLNALLSLSTALCWGSLFQLLIGGNQSNQGSLSTSLLSLLLVPLMVPTCLVGWEWINALVRGDYWGYYLGMQGGLLLASLSISLGLAPLIIKNTEQN